MAKKPRIFSIAELIHGGRPLTGAASLNSDLRCPSISPQSSLSNQSTPPIPSNSTSNPNPRILTPLNYPALIDGNLTLPAVSDGASSSNSTIRCSCNSCFQFSDGSATICCDILDLDPFIIGKKIRVLAWNFIPIKRVGGFLEIIRWSFPDSENGRPRCLDGDSFPFAPSSSCGCENSSKSRYRLHGSLESVSPISVNPCTSGDSNSRSTTGSNSKPAFNIRGFLVRILVCECRLCNSKESFTILNCSVQEQNAHNFTKPVIVYFCGSASSWRPVIVKLIGKVVTISGLKKKLVYIGNEESILMYVTSEKSYLHVPRFQEKFVPGNQTYVEGKGECGSYTGIVKGVYMQGMVVELDHEVWLLLTSHLFTAPHSLRIGALISVKNVHFVNPKFSWTKMLILGACYKTSITIKCFSPFVTGCHILSDSRSIMGNFIESLTFSARLWVLLLVSCFRKKFAGIFSEKEILGSKHREGLVQMYANSQLPSSMFLSSVNKHGIFMLLCKHDSCGCEGRSGNLILIVPIVTFINHCHAKWMRMIQLEHDKTLQKENLHSLLLCEGRPYDQSIRKIFSSEDIGIVLIGNLKISPTSGRLQLVDATGRIDVIVPDLLSTWNSNSIFEVVDYNLIIEGMPRLADNGLLDKCFSCRSIFNFIPLARDENLTVYVYFHLRNTACRNVSFYPRIEFGEDLERLENQTYHMLQVTHKFPALEKFQGDTTMSDPPSMFAEAVILSWNLSIAGKDGFVHATKNSGDQPKKCMEHCNGKNDQEHISKRRKVDHASSRELSGLVDIPHNAERLRTCSNSDAESSGKHSCCNCTSHEIPSSATIKAAKNQSVVRSVILNYLGSNLNGRGLCRRSAHKVFLEFKPENFHIYQLLQIGCYYITEHYKEDSFCNFTDSDYVSGVKVLVSSKLHLWSLSLTPDDVLPPTNLANCPPSDNSCHIGGDVVSSEAYNELCLQMPNRDCLESCSDVSLCLPANMRDILEVNMSELEECLIKPAVRPEGIAEFSSCTGDVASAPLLPDINFLLPEGNLISLRGHVVTVHGVDTHGNSQNHGDPLWSRLFSGVATTSCFHVMAEHRIVKVVGSLSKHVFPPGFGPGVDATFHRVLELRSQNKWMLTPVSFIVIHSIKAVNKSCSEKCTSLVSDMKLVASLSTFSSGLISELVQHPDSELMRFHCRVVAVNILVFTNCKKDVHLPLEFRSRQHQIDIPIAGFVLDDGSFPCCCWANAERASTLLKLHEELPERAYKSNVWTLKGFKTDNTRYTIRYHLERILEKHDMITVKNFGSLFDSSYQDLVISVSSDNTLSGSDENFLKYVVFNACFGSFWTIVASFMDSDAVGQLEKENLLHMEMSTSSMQNIWAKEVCHTDAFTKARDVIQELLDRFPLDFAKMSLPLNQQAPPVTAVTQPSYNNVNVSHGSIGPVVAVLIVIMILGAIAVVVGRMCSGKRIMGYGQFNVESWAERKCSSCIDGRINGPLPRANGSVTSVPV